MPVRERQPESRWGRAEALEEKSRRKLPARSSSRGCRGAAGGRSCQQKRKVSIKVKLDAGWSHFRSTFGINVIIWSHRCWEMVIMVFKCQMAPLATASSLRVYQRNSVFYAINVSNILAKPFPICWLASSKYGFSYHTMSCLCKSGFYCSRLEHLTLEFIYNSWQKDILNAYIVSLLSRCPLFCIMILFLCIFTPF